MDARRSLPSIERALIIASIIVVVGALAGVAIFRAAGWRPNPTSVRPVAAQDFRLTDQTGSRYDLASARGKAVVLAILYTHCTDECPFAAEKLKYTYDHLSPRERAMVDFVVVSADPVGDTLSTVASYSKQIGMYDAWHYLIGSRAELQPIWNFYSAIEPTPDANAGAELSPKNGLGTSELLAASAVITKFGGSADVEHPTTIWLIDPGHDVVNTVGFGIEPSGLVSDVVQLVSD